MRVIPLGMYDRIGVREAYFIRGTHPEPICQMNGVLDTYRARHISSDSSGFCYYKCIRHGKAGLKETA
ncbi:hypothetical protein J41TS12_20350 [Paenibacillus antibioticophila]|uniref:Uncharacterized protein n=1 Tax=Paenibacillus antibioticophila TaxID=1274374 RepID=A0A919XQJ3_9BACL|nr:hypothetical protein J41TS12_20350 [Paenibacillus antibioticophila]